MTKLFDKLLGDLHDDWRAAGQLPEGSTLAVHPKTVGFLYLEMREQVREGNFFGALALDQGYPRTLFGYPIAEDEAVAVYALSVRRP